MKSDIVIGVVLTVFGIYTFSRADAEHLFEDNVAHSTDNITKLLKIAISANSTLDTK